MSSTPPSPSRPAPSRGKKLLFAAALAALAAAALEIVSAGAFFWLEGELPSPARIAARRAQIAEEPLQPDAAGDSPAAPDAEDLAHRLPHFLAMEALHPYLGYVADPGVNREANPLFAGFPVGDLGFYRSEAPPRSGDDTFTVAFFGGSVAFLTAITGHTALEERLEAAPELAGRRVAVEPFALPGYKQPQQLQTLSYLLALGLRFDVVINLDGFNEVTLGVADDYARGVFPHFPRNWDQRVLGTAEPEQLRRMAEVAAERQRRRELAGAFSRGPLTWSATWNLLWSTLDRRRAAAVAAAETRLAEVPPPEASFAARGPAREYASERDLLLDLARVWARSSLQMHRLSRANGMRYYHFVQPNQYVPGSKPLSAQEKRRAFREDHRLRPYVVAGYPLLLREGEDLERQGVSFHDLTDLFQGVEETRYIDFCCHLNQQGTERMIEVIAAEILDDLEAPPH
jgi:hypothetical protein